MKFPFKYYLHDDASRHEMAEYLQPYFPEDRDIEEIVELLGRPFYEVTLDCILDTETGEITLVKASL